jgi:hypothetical protein
MSSNKHRAETPAIVLAVMALALLAPPALAHADAPDATGARQSKKVPRTQGMKVAAQKPNGSGIVVRYRLEGTPSAGRTVPVALALDRVVGADASVRFETDAGLRLGDGADPRALIAGRNTALTVDVVPGSEGTSYLHVFTTQNGITSVASIPVSVGKGGGALPAVGELKSSPEGDRLISMPVK